MTIAVDMGRKARKTNKKQTKTAEAGVSQSDGGCRILFNRQRMQDYLNQTANGGDPLSVADAGDSLSDSACRSLSI